MATQSGAISDLWLTVTCEALCMLPSVFWSLISVQVLRFQATHASEIVNKPPQFHIFSVATQSSYLSVCINNCGRYMLTIDHRINETVSDWKQMRAMRCDLGYFFSLNTPPAPTNPAFLNPLFPKFGHHGLENLLISTSRISL